MVYGANIVEFKLHHMKLNRPVLWCVKPLKHQDVTFLPVMLRSATDRYRLIPVKTVIKNQCIPINAFHKNRSVGHILQAVDALCAV